MVNERVQRQIDRLLDQAEEAMGQLDWEVVRQRSQAVLSLQSDNDVAETYLEAAVKALGEPDVAVAPITNLPSAKVIAEPASFAKGRYQVKEFLGEGGRKRVYRSHDSVLDRDVALAVIKTEGLDPTSRVRITREAQAMGRLGDHPHVLSIHDLGEDNGQPYMVLPLMPGGDVGTLLEKAEDHRLPLEQAIDLAAQICRGLEFAHSKEIVHRDLKPGNIWLTADGTARIGDFGLAVAIDRSRLTQEGMMVGTVSYMPPEQAMGGDVTPQSDLYSLGAMLYEMVTGRPPFLGDDSVAIIGQHINTPPVAPTWHNPKCPRALEALVLRLLAKDPRERPDSATDVIKALEGVDLAVSAEAVVAEHDEAHVLDSLAGGVFVGRQREMGELKAAVEDALSGRGRLVTLVGEPGIGKTRTAEELATYARMRGAQVLWGRCHESRGAPPYWPWVQAIRSYVRECEPDRLRSEMGSGAADIAEIVSDVTERIPGLHLLPKLDDPEQARFRLFDSITAFLRSASRSQPQVIMLDNLHWADKPSLLLLEFLAQEFADSRLLVIGTYRDMDLSRQHPLAETLGQLTRERLFQRVLLRGLSQEDVRRFIEVTSGISPPRGLVRAVRTQTEGNPLFVTEVVRLLVQEGELSHDGVDERESWEVRIPEGVREVIGRRLNRLSQRCNEMLTIASVIGREFEMRQLSRLVEDVSEQRLREAVDESLSARVIEELPQVVDGYQFTHAMIRQTLYDELTTTQRVRLHARVGELLEQLFGSDAEAHADELAHHFAEAEAVLGPDKLVRYSVLAAERALAGYGYEEALIHFRRALVARADRHADAEKAAMQHGLGRAHAALFQAQEAWDNLKQAFDYYAESGDVASAVAVAEFPIVLSPGEAIVTPVIERALRLVRAGSVEEGRLLSRYGFAASWELGESSRSDEAFHRGLTIARRENDTRLEIEILNTAANVDLNSLHWHRSLERSLRAVELARTIDDQSAEARAHRWAAIVLVILGRPDEAEAETKSLSALAEGSHNQVWRATVLQLDGETKRLKGEWLAAREFNDRNLELRREELYLILSSRTSVEYETGNLDQGESFLGRFFDVVQASPLEPSIHYAFLAMVVGTATRVRTPSDRLEDAWIAAETVLSAAATTPLNKLIAANGLALLAIERGDGGTAASQYSALEAHRGTILPFGSVTCDRLLGLVAQISGRLDDAATHYDESLTFCREAGYRPELAWTLCDQADLLLERDADGDRRRAAALLGESLAISSALRMSPLVEQVLSLRMRLQGVDVSSPETSIEAVVSAVGVTRPNLGRHAAPDGTVTIMFTDIEDSTGLTESMGDQRWMALLRAHNGIVHRQVAAHEGFEVKSQGDGFMVAFSSARRALECSIAIQRGMEDYNARGADHPVRVRIGLHTGEAVKEGEDFFGKTVILAARIASQAQGEQILVSSLLKALVESSGQFAFGEGRDVELKGLAGFHRVFQVRRD